MNAVNGPCICKKRRSTDCNDVFLNVCHIWGAKRICSQGGIALKADGYIFSVPWCGVEYENGQAYHKILKSAGVLEPFVVVLASLTFATPCLLFRSGPRFWPAT